MGRVVRRRVPYIAQMEATECGAASLAMVLAYWGHHAPLTEIRQACGVSRDGSNAKNILAAARSYGLVAKARRCEPEDLARCEGPAILHWRLDHFLVLDRWTRSTSHLVDPARGRRAVSAEEMDRSFTGICLELAPGPDFVRRPPARRTLVRYRELLRGSARALAIVVIATLLLDLLALGLPLTTQLVIDRVVGAGHAEWLWSVAIGAAAILVLHAFYTWSRDTVIRRLRQRLDVLIGARFVRHLLSLPVGFFYQRGAGDLLARANGNQRIRELLTGSTIALLVDGLMLVAYLALMLAFDVTLSAIVALAGALQIAVYLGTRRLLAAAAEQLQQKEVAAGTVLLDTLSGIATVKAAGIEDRFRARWLDATVHAVNAQSRFARLEHAIGTALTAIRLAVPLAVLGVGGARAIAGDVTVGTLVAFQMLQAGFLTPLVTGLQTLLRLEIVPVLFDRMDDVLGTAVESNGSLPTPRLRGEISIEDVSFRYGPRSPLVLDRVSLRAPKGAKVAIVGASGCGKSTLARLLMALYEPTHGRIRLDGQDLAELDRAGVRRQYGVVMQESAIVEGTIADNVRLYHPTLTMEEVIAATRAAQLHDDIVDLPDGYDTHLSPHGGPLSGGQRQRLVIARAIAHRPPILIFDEATSALDAPTEAAIEHALSSYGSTRIVIAHRRSTFQSADVICVLEAGRLVEQGTHADLVARGGRYAALVASESATSTGGAPEVLEVEDEIAEPSRGGLPIARTDASATHAACLSAILGAAGGTVPLAAVMTAMGSLRPGQDPVIHAARQLGWDARRLELLPGELEKSRRALIVEGRDGRAFVVEPLRRGTMRVIDPASGISHRRPRDLRGETSGWAYELEPRVPVARASLRERLVAYARRETKGIAQLVGLTIAVELATMGSAIAAAFVVGTVVPAEDPGLLVTVISASAALSAALVTFTLLRAHASDYLGAHFDHAMGNQLMAHLLRLPITFFDRRPTGDVIRRFHAFDEVRRALSTQGTTTILSIVSFLMAAVLLAALQPVFAIVAVLEVVLYVSLGWFVFARLAGEAARERAHRAVEQSRLLELLTGIATFRLAGDAERALGRWLPSFVGAVSHATAQDRLRTTTVGVLDTARAMGLLAAVVLGADAVVNGNRSLTSLVAALGVLGAFSTSLHALAVQLLAAAPNAVDYAFVDETFAEPVEQSAPTPIAPGVLGGRIRLERVSFRYPGPGPLVLDDVSLTVEPGTKVALVGRTGAGKSTLGKLLLAMHMPTCGRVLFDEHDLASLDLQAVRSQIGAVLQEPYLAAGTLRENIALTAEGASYADVVDAAKRAALHDDIASLPMGYQTLVTDGGTTFSGGQRQRCVIARALLSSPSILLLDEATSALDAESQRVVETHLARSKATRIVIAHRLSTVIDADQIVVVERGRIVEAGRHDELIAKRGAYFDLVRAQSG